MIRDDIRTTLRMSLSVKLKTAMTTRLSFCGRKQIPKDLADAGVLYDKFENKAEIDIDATANWLKQTRDISGWDEEKIKTANTGTNVFVKANIQIQDAMEDLKFTIYMS